MNSFGNDGPVLIRTKLQRPRLDSDLIQRPQLIDRLNRGLDRKLTLVSAQAGAGKTTLLSQWLERCSQPSAWLSLDEHDNDLMVFASYLCASVKTVFPNACKHVLDLLNAPQRPPTRIVTASLVNDLDSLFGENKLEREVSSLNGGLILALDDFQNITDPAIHDFMTEFITYLPRGLHIAMTSRTDPGLPLAGLRARREMTEVRTVDLCFSTEEVRALLELTFGLKLSGKTVDLLEDKTEGWAVGLRLAALSLQDVPDQKTFVQQFERAGSSMIVDYLVNEVLSRQSPAKQVFLLQTSILERFNADLCAALFQQDDLTKAGSSLISSQNILEELSAANLFLNPLDQEGWWFRYHHLFRDLLKNRLQRRYDPETIIELHNRASRWFEQQGLIGEALSHAFSAGDLERAARIVSRQRYSLMNQARWRRLDRYLSRFPPEFANQHPDLLMLKAWLIYHQGHYAQLPATLERLEEVLDQSSLPPEPKRHLEGEIGALHSLMTYFRSDVGQTIAAAEFSIKNTPPELWIVRILARVYLAGAMLMDGDLRRAYDVIYQGMDQEVIQSEFYTATMLVTLCSLHWAVADLESLTQAAQQCLDLYDRHQAKEIEGFGHYHLGCASYHRDDLAAAEDHFGQVVKQPYLNYGDAYASSAFGLSLTYQALNRPDEAREVAETAVKFMVETGNSTLLPVAQAFRAELALRQGQLAAATQWADQFEANPPLSPMVRFYRPVLTLVKIWLAQGTPHSIQRASEFLGQLHEYAQSTHNTSVLIEVLALQALLYDREDDEPAALATLERAIELAEPGGFIRLFVDLGHPVARLLHSLEQQTGPSTYISQLLAAFAVKRGSLTESDPQPSSGDTLPESLTHRELEVLELLAKRLTNKEIADRLVISPTTVKTHTLNIYAKLDVHGRQQAVKKARDLGLISPT